jgi:hypothetical protein
MCLKTVRNYMQILHGITIQKIQLTFTFTLLCFKPNQIKVKLLKGNYLDTQQKQSYTTLKDPHTSQSQASLMHAK